MKEIKNRQLIIIGGGYSLKKPIEDGLWDKLKDKYAFGLNYNYKHFDSTCLMGVDDEFYNLEFENLKNIPLIVFGYDKDVKKWHPNTLKLKCHNKYLGRDLNQGVYSSRLTGMFALTLGVYLLDIGEIFLLGYDFGWKSDKVINKQYATHYYQGTIKHRGIGHISYYNSKGRIKSDFAPYKDEKKVKIYNVIGDPESKIETFEKIDYNTFYKLLDNKIYNQKELRVEIRKKLKEYKL